MFSLREDTASQEIILGPFVDATDGSTAETGLTIANTDIKIWKHGATSETNKNSGGGTHIAGGRYSVVLDATDTDTAGNIQISVHVAGALPVWVHGFVFPTAVYDLQIGVTSLGTQQTGDTYARLGAPAGASHAADVAAVKVDTAAILVDTGTTLDARIPAALVSGRMDASVGAMAANTLTAAATAADFGTEVGAAVLAAAAADPIDANMEQINTVAVTGDGSGTPFGV